MITVGTPFYGTSTHQDRYYQGQSPLNIFYRKRRVAEIAGTLPGPYVLMFADKTTLDAPTRAALGLSAYPVSDSATGAPADPYDSANFNRYPPWVSRSALEAAVLARETITASLPAAVAQRVFHIRSGLDNKTATALRWDAVNGASYNPDTTASPLIAVKGAGDGTVPFWAARLAQIPDTQVFSISQKRKATAASGASRDTRGHPPARKQRTMPKPAALAAVPDKTLGTSEASRAKTDKFIVDALAGRIKKGDARANDPEVWRRILEEAQLC